MKKILIRVPDLLLAGVCHYHFFVRLRQQLPQAEIYLLVPIDQLSFYRHLELFQLRLLSLPSEITSWWKIYRFVRTLPSVLPVDSYIDLVNDHRSAFLGWCLQARARFGHKLGVGGWFVNRPLRPYRNSLEIMAQMDGQLLPSDFGVRIMADYQKVASISTDDLVYRPFFFVFLGEMHSKHLQEFWKNLLEQFSGQTFIFYRKSTDLNIIEFLQQLNKQNEYRVLLDDDGTKFSNFIIKAQAVIGTEAWQGALAAYFSCRSFLFDFHQLGENFLALLPFQQQPEIIQFRSGGFWFSGSHNPADQGCQEFGQECGDEESLAQAILSHLQN